MSIYERWGLTKVINARGFVTALGSGLMAPEVTEAMIEASKAYVLMSELNDKASEVIAAVTGAEAGCVTSGAAAGIAIATAACMTGTDIGRVERIPHVSSFPKNEVVIQRGHLNRYLLMIQMTGATVVPYGFIDGPGSATRAQLRAAITERTAAAYYVTAWHRHHRGELSLRDTVEAAHERGVPVVVDAADVPDVRSATAAGADLVAISGGKNLLGPGSSGLVAGKGALIQACRMQGTGWGIARPMKVSKEETVGLIVALERYARLDHRATWREWHARCRALAARLQDLSHVTVRVLEHDDAGGPAAFVQINLDERTLGRTANEVNEALIRGNPSIRVREYFAYVGSLELDIRTLPPEHEEVLVARLREELVG